jgi:ATP-dependent Clp protease adapter protein ClpS
VDKIDNQQLNGIETVAAELGPVLVWLTKTIHSLVHHFVWLFKQQYALNVNVPLKTEYDIPEVTVATHFQVTTASPAENLFIRPSTVHAAERQESFDRVIGPVLCETMTNLHKLIVKMDRVVDDLLQQHMTSSSTVVFDRSAILKVSLDVLRRSKTVSRNLLAAVTDKFTECSKAIFSVNKMNKLFSESHNEALSSEADVHSNGASMSSTVTAAYAEKLTEGYPLVHRPADESKTKPEVVDKGEKGNDATKDLTVHSTYFQVTTASPAENLFIRPSTVHAAERQESFDRVIGPVLCETMTNLHKLIVKMYRVVDDLLQQHMTSSSTVVFDRSAILKVSLDVIRRSKTVSRNLLAAVTDKFTECSKAIFSVNKMNKLFSESHNEAHSSEADVHSNGASMSSTVTAAYAEKLTEGYPLVHRPADESKTKPEVVDKGEKGNEIIEESTAPTVDALARVAVRRKDKDDNGAPKQRNESMVNSNGPTNILVKADNVGNHLLASSLTATSQLSTSVATSMNEGAVNVLLDASSTMQTALTEYTSPVNGQLSGVPFTTVAASSERKFSKSPATKSVRKSKRTTSVVKVTKNVNGNAFKENTSMPTRKSELIRNTDSNRQKDEDESFLEHHTTLPFSASSVRISSKLPASKLGRKSKRTTSVVKVTKNVNGNAFKENTSMPTRKKGEDESFLGHHTTLPFSASSVRTSSKPASAKLVTESKMMTTSVAEVTKKLNTLEESVPTHKPEITPTTDNINGLEQTTNVPTHKSELIKTTDSNRQKNVDESLLRHHFNTLPTKKFELERISLETEYSRGPTSLESLRSNRPKPTSGAIQIEDNVTGVLFVSTVPRSEFKVAPTVVLPSTETHPELPPEGHIITEHEILLEMEKLSRLMSEVGRTIYWNVLHVAEVGQSLGEYRLQMASDRGTAEDMWIEYMNSLMMKAKSVAEKQQVANDALFIANNIYLQVYLNLLYGINSPSIIHVLFVSIE